MSASTTSRLVLRHTRFFVRQSARRHASTTESASSAASKSKEVASSTTSKASQGLSKVTSSAGPAVRGAAQGVQTRIASIGGRAGKIVSFVESMIPPTIYYSKVAFEVAKLTFQGQRMSPPSAAAFQEYFAPLLHAIRNPTRLQHLITDSAHSAATTARTMGPGDVLNMIRNLSTKDFVAAGVIGAEMLGFFTVGEMIGKFKVVGYRGGVHDHAH